MMWSVRLLHEQKGYDTDCCFITLTYDEEHNPKTLVPKDLQDFWKRLRKYSGLKLRYFACGEYGSKTMRPHYHAIVFGLPNNDDTRKLLVDCWNKCSPDRFLPKSGGLAPITPADIMYVCGYVQKKYADSTDYEKLGLVPPFQRQSKGLGLEELDRNDVLKQQIETLGYIPYQGKKLGVPRYYIDKRFEHLKSQRSLANFETQFDELCSYLDEDTARSVALHGFLDYELFNHGSVGREQREKNTVRLRKKNETLHTL